MAPSRTLADPRLTVLLGDLLTEEHLPPLDRWFSSYARRSSWPILEQKRLWDALRRALTRGYGLLSAASSPEVTGWSGFRLALGTRAQEWAIRTDLPANPDPSVAEAGIPGWLLPALSDRERRSNWGPADRQRFLSSQEVSPPVHVRFREGAEGQACRDRLTQAGVLGPSDLGGIFCLAGGQGLEGTEDWKAGLVEIQDAASQLSLARLGIRPGMRVWDVCAGKGGKTLLAARDMRGKGALVATDVAENKLKTLKERVRRSGWQNIRLQAWDGLTVPHFGPEVASRGGFDRVIVDAPCTATGTWRRDPEGRFRISPQVVREVGKHQERLVRLGWAALQPGGLLAYVTCSWLPVENEGVVEAFRQETGATLVHQELLGLPAFDANTLFVSILEKP